MKDYITDEEFEVLEWYEQREYYWCQKCGMYHRGKNRACKGGGNRD